MARPYALRGCKDVHSVSLDVLTGNQVSAKPLSIWCIFRKDFTLRSMATWAGHSQTASCRVMAKAVSRLSMWQSSRCHTLTWLRLCSLCNPNWMLCMVNWPSCVALTSSSFTTWLPLLENGLKWIQISPTCCTLEPAVRRLFSSIDFLGGSYWLRLVDSRNTLV